MLREINIIGFNLNNDRTRYFILAGKVNPANYKCITDVVYYVYIFILEKNERTKWFSIGILYSPSHLYSGQ